MAEDLAPISTTKRKFDSGPNFPEKRVSYNSVPPPLSDFEKAKQRAEQIAARLVAQDSKRSRFEDGSPDPTPQSGGPPEAEHKEFASDGGNPVQFFENRETVSSMHGNFYNMQGPPESRKMEIPNPKVGLVIGKGGETIKYLQQQSGARIQITRDSEHNPHVPFRMVELMGTSEQIGRAEQLIKDVIAEADAAGTNFVAPNYAHAPQNTVGEQININVPNNKVGLIIGRGGETIRSLQSRTGARIQLVPLPGPPDFNPGAITERMITLIGTKQQIDAASELVKEIISENRMRGPPVQGGYNQTFRPPPGPPQWGPPGGPPLQQQGYGYPQQGYGYPQQGPYYAGPPQQYGSYPQQPPTGWDQRPPAPVQQPQQAGSYGYYNQQGHVGGNPANSSHSYNQPQVGGYDQQASYGDQSYGPPGAPQEYGQQPPGQEMYGQQTYGQQPEPYGQTVSAHPNYGPPGMPSPYGQPGIASTAFTHQGSQQGYGQTGAGEQIYGQQGSGQHVYGQQEISQQSYGQQQGPDQSNFEQPVLEDQSNTKIGSEQGHNHQGSDQTGYGQQGSFQVAYGQQGSAELNHANQAPSKPSVHGQQRSSQPVYGVQDSHQPSYGQQGTSQLESGQQQSYMQGPQQSFEQPGYGDNQEQKTATQSTYDQPAYGNGYQYNAQGASGHASYGQHMQFSESNEATGNIAASVASAQVQLDEDCAAQS